MNRTMEIMNGSLKVLKKHGEDEVVRIIWFIQERLLQWGVHENVSTHIKYRSHWVEIKYTPLLHPHKIIKSLNTLSIYIYIYMGPASSLRSASVKELKMTQKQDIYMDYRHGKATLVKAIIYVDASLHMIMSSFVPVQEQENKSVWSLKPTRLPPKYRINLLRKSFHILDCSFPLKNDPKLQTWIDREVGNQIF